jgi:DNA-binding YbaB/EbfC family protein
MSILGQLGQLASLMKNLPKMREEAEKLQRNIAALTADGDAGGGMVRARVNGRMEVLRCQISDDLLQMNDREMLEDLIRAAINQAIQKVRHLIAEETSKMASSLGLPAGMPLPGLE